MSTDSSMGFAEDLVVVWRWISEKMHFRKDWTTTSVRSEPRTSVVRLRRINYWDTQWSPTGIWIPDLFFSFIKENHWATPSTVTEWSSRICLTHLSVNTPSHKIHVNFDPHFKTKSFSTPRHKTNHSDPCQVKPSQFRSKHKNEVIFDPQTQNKSIPIPHVFRSPY